MHKTARRWSHAASVALLIIVGMALPAFSGSIDTIRANQTIRIAYRPDAPPFSYKEADVPEPGGYMVNLCRAVAKKLGDQLGLPSLKVAYVAVTAANRFEAIQKHDADLLCEPTSATLSRRKLVDFSIPTFVDGASLLTNDMSLQHLNGLAGHKIGVLNGTTTEASLRRMLQEQGISAEVIPAKSHDEGLGMLEDGATSVYFGDRSVLMFLIKNLSKAPEKLLVSEDYLTVEPYALALARGDEDFRLAVDAALSHIFRSNEIIKIYDDSFGGKLKRSDLIEALYVISGLPD
jgi:ABC-type amino acid transport substrate-binding protein